MDVTEIARRVKQGKTITPAEFAALISNDKEAFMEFLIRNNPASMNDILKNRLGYTHELGFYPDQKTLFRLVQMILDKENKAELNTILQNFQLNTSGISPATMAALKTAFNAYQYK